MDIAQSLKRVRRRLEHSTRGYRSGPKEGGGYWPKSQPYDLPGQQFDWRDDPKE